MTNPLPAAERLATALAAELERLGCWRSAPPDFDAARDGPFGMYTMPFETWLQIVLVPVLRGIARGERPLPPRSQLAAHAVREFDGRDDRAALVALLHEIDALGRG